MTLADLPQLPAPHAELVNYIAQNSDKPMTEIMDPYRKYEAQLRSVFAQDHQNPILNDPYVNVVPLFTESTRHITTRARDLASETEEEKSKYIMSLPEEKRRAHGSPATVSNLAEFQKNFNIFSESSLAELDWSNVVAAGSSVVNTLLPVPDDFNTSKRKLREYYHDKFCPASDVDLFLYGLTHDQAVEKIKQIERAVRDSILNEITVIRTKHAITIASQYPVRHVQIVLRVYKSVSEILTGFDIDAAGAAYDGKQVYVTPRALGSFITQVNHIDLTRRSPSYENRLSKYSHRNFEIYWSDLDRSRIDPSIFERSFRRTLGLARLLVLERLPTSYAREKYLNKRRQERGRPAVNRTRFDLKGNIKGKCEDEVADWSFEDDVSNYHTFTIPYGEKFTAKRIEKLSYTRDLLLNAEWNQPEDRKVYLHRHPAFFGRVEDVIEDCCGCCPEPVTPEEIEVAEKEAQTYISGKISFLTDDPGRQQIGSFNPSTDQDWTDMAYVGNVSRLFYSIVNNDVHDVLNWLSQEGANPSQRDYTGRTPLHLAVSISTPEIVQSLVNHGARLTARLADGKTALHLAAARGDTEIIRILLDKSIENDEIEEEKKAKRKQRAKSAKTTETQQESVQPSSEEARDVEEDSDIDMVDDKQTDTDVHSIATGSFVKVKKGQDDDGDDEVALDEAEDEPDCIDVDALAWDVPCSPIHLAIAGGHEGAVQLLCDYGADSILPTKFLNKGNPDETVAILTLTLALTLPLEKAKSMAALLLRLGATSSQADSTGCTAFHRYVQSGKTELVDILLENDKTAIKSAINHLTFTNYSWSPDVVSPLIAAIEHNDSILVLKLLDAGSRSQIDFDMWLKAAKISPSQSNHLASLEQNEDKYRETVEQPLISAILSGSAKVAIELLEHGANPNALTAEAERVVGSTSTYHFSWTKGESALDLVQFLIMNLRNYSGENRTLKEPKEPLSMDSYLNKFKPGSYEYFMVSEDIASVKSNYNAEKKKYDDETKTFANLRGAPEKREAIDEAIKDLCELENALVAKGGLKFTQLHPDIKLEGRRELSSSGIDNSNTAVDYKYAFSFSLDTDMTEARAEGYRNLMQAAWAGDIEVIKSLTLQTWGKDQDQVPLKMAIHDKNWNSPFSIAFLRGHYDVAQSILEIVNAQWSPAEDDKLRYKMENDDDVDEELDEDASEANGSDDEPKIVSEKVDKQFTIDNIGEVSMQVKSHSTPGMVIRRASPGITVENGTVKSTPYNSLYIHVMEKDDIPALKILLDMAQQFTDSDASTNNDDEYGWRAGVPNDPFEWALEHGKVQALSLLIKKTGAGIPLDHLVKKSGVELNQKPRYYQGLTVYGKKRKDWATAGRNMAVRTTGLKTAPLLHAAIGGHIEGVEFCLSDAPHRLYSEFAKTKAASEDPRLKHLKDSPGGFDRAIATWLGTDNDLALHSAILSEQSDDSIEVIKYLIKTCPDSLEKRTSQGDTPLLIACRLGRPMYVKLLVDGNADQSVRNHKGENVLHAALSENPTAGRLQRVLDALDPELRSHLFLERKSLQENGTTPLHAWVSQVCGIELEDQVSRPPKPYKKVARIVDVARLLLRYSQGKELGMFNGAGDTCLHTAMLYNMPSLVKVLVDYKPQILYRENAVGRTPAEFAQDRAIVDQFRRPAEIRLNRNLKLQGWNHRSAIEFVKDATVEGLTPEQLKQKVTDLGLRADYTADEVAGILNSMGLAETEATLETLTLHRVIWDICQTAMQQYQGKRRLVSLNEANDVARRLGENNARPKSFTIRSRRDKAKADDEAARARAYDDEYRVDWVVETLGLELDDAWCIREYEAKHFGIEKCKECDGYHE